MNSELPRCSSLWGLIVDIFFFFYINYYLPGS
jgi:hypothetical protein